MKISKNTTLLLQKLANGESVAFSLLPKQIAETLCAEGFLTVRTKGSRRSFSAIDTKALMNYLSAEYGNLDSSCDNYQTRAQQASISGNSKLVYIRSCPGFPVNSYDPIECTLNGHEFVLSPQEGSFVFIANWETFVIPKDIVIVGIENMENFRKIRQEKKLFESTIGNKRLLFVSRYPQSTDLRMWLQTVSNPYIHFGDFDLAGIHIFLSEFYLYLGNRASFLIPLDIEERLKTGSTERYNFQYPRFHNLNTDIASLQNLVNQINNYHRCYDQEGYIEIE